MQNALFNSRTHLTFYFSQKGIFSKSFKLYLLYGILNKAYTMYGKW